MSSEVGKLLILSGVVILIFGVILTVGHKIPLIGKLPGDFKYESGNFKLYFPLATSILISIILTILFNLFRK